MIALVKQAVALASCARCFTPGVTLETSSNEQKATQLDFYGGGAAVAAQCASSNVLFELWCKFPFCPAGNRMI